jgi:hypothetical protein
MNIQWSEGMGLTKRELFAAIAMQGWISASPKVGGVNAKGTFEDGLKIAIASVNYADALMSQLSKEPQA